MGLTLECTQPKKPFILSLALLIFKVYFGSSLFQTLFDSEYLILDCFPVRAEDSLPCSHAWSPRFLVKHILSLDYFNRDLSICESSCRIFLIYSICAELAVDVRLWIDVTLSMISALNSEGLIPVDLALNHFNLKSTFLQRLFVFFLFHFPLFLFA